MKKAAKHCVATKNAESLNELYTQLGTPVKEKTVFCLAHGWEWKTKGNTEGYFVQYLNGSVLMHPNNNVNHCKDNFCYPTKHGNQWHHCGNK